MTEQEWLGGQCFDRMLWHLSESVLRTTKGRRRIRCFEYACLLRVWHLLDDDFRNWADIVARCAQQEPLRKELLPFFSEAESRSVAGKSRQSEKYACWAVVHALRGGAVYSRTWHVAIISGNALLRSAVEQRIDRGEGVGQMGFSVQEQADRDGQLADLLREIFGNPFRPLPNRKWSADIRGLAQSCYEDASNYPMLADALEDAGEEEASAHCRLPGHVKGCHVVDWILGKS